MGEWRKQSSFHCLTRWAGTLRPMSYAGFVRNADGPDVCRPVPREHRFASWFPARAQSTSRLQRHEIRTRPRCSAALHSRARLRPLTPKEACAALLYTRCDRDLNACVIGSLRSAAPRSWFSIRRKSPAPSKRELTRSSRSRFSLR